MNPTDNQTPQPVDNELDEILDELNIEYNEYRGEMYHIDPLKYEKKIRPIAKARLLQWGTRQRLIELERLQRLHTRTYRQTITDNMGENYLDDTHSYISKYETQNRIAELQASLKDGGNDE